MFRFVVVGSMLIAFGFIGEPSQSQKKDSAATARSPRSSITVATGDTLHGVKHFIKIAPGDSANVDNMPMHNPQDRLKPISWKGQPEILLRVEPEYPPAAREKKLEGTVLLRCLVRIDGTVGNVVLLKTDAEEFVKPAMEAAKRWVFTKPTVNGKPRSVWVALPIHFKLKN